MDSVHHRPTIEIPDRRPHGFSEDSTFSHASSYASSTDEMKGTPHADAPKFANVSPLPHINPERAEHEILGLTTISCAPVVRAHNFCYLLFTNQYSNHLLVELIKIHIDTPEFGSFRLTEDLEKEIGKRVSPNSADPGRHGRRMLLQRSNTPHVKDAVLQWTFSWFDTHLLTRKTQFTSIPPPPKVHAHVLDWLIKTTTLAQLFDNLCQFGIYPHKHPLKEKISSLHETFLYFFITIINPSPELSHLLSEWQHHINFATKAYDLQIKSMEGFIAFAQLHALQNTLTALNGERLIKYLKHMKRVPLSDTVKDTILQKAFPDETFDTVLSYLNEENSEALSKLLAKTGVQTHLAKGIEEQIQSLIAKHK